MGLADAPVGVRALSGVLAAETLVLLDLVRVRVRG